ncbi:MAG: YciI family protein [Acidobacteriia bacterium]|nr:YciI family protein [Terriglobia bacterium]
MQYLLLIYGNEAQWDTKNEAERNTILQEYMQFTKSIVQSGHYRGGNELNVTSTATTVRVRDKKQVVTDGPFAETKEQLGGYYLIEAKDLDDVLGVAARIPTARWGSIEVRPIIPHDMPS